MYEKSESEIESRLDGAITSILENRLPVFLPIQKLHQSRIEKIFSKNKNVVCFDTEFGRLEMRNRLVTQNHKMYLEAMLSYRKQKLLDGSFSVKFRIHDLLKTKLMKKNPTDYATFKKYFKELKDIHLVFLLENGQELGFGFIDDYRIDNNTGEYEVKFTRMLSSVWENENLISYKEVLPHLSQVNVPIVTSVIRYMATFGNSQISVKNLAKKLGLNQVFSRSALFEKLNDIRNSFNPDFEGNELSVYEKFGISYDKNFDNILISRNEEIFVEYKKGKTLSTKLITSNNS